MKIARKPIHALEDCLDVSQTGHFGGGGRYIKHGEGVVHVRLSTHGHRIIANVEQGNDCREIELDVLSLHRIIRDEIRRVTGD